jgi:hypothetical protein
MKEVYCHSEPFGYAQGKLREESGFNRLLNAKKLTERISASR